jgi:hypothetical protein
MSESKHTPIRDDTEIGEISIWKGPDSWERYPVFTMHLQPWAKERVKADSEGMLEHIDRLTDEQVRMHEEMLEEMLEEIQTLRAQRDALARKLSQVLGLVDGAMDVLRTAIAAAKGK